MNDCERIPVLATNINVRETEKFHYEWLHLFGPIPTTLTVFILYH